MRNALLFVLLFPGFIATAADPVPRPPVIIHPSYDSSSPSAETDEKSRFQAVENTGGTGFYWLDSSNGNLWRLDRTAMEWNFCGSPRGADTVRKGTYQLLSDRNGGVYVLHTGSGEGWWTDGVTWKIIGEPSRRIKKAE